MEEGEEVKMKPSTRVTVGWMLFILGITLGGFSLMTYIVDTVMIVAGIIRFVIFLLCVALLIIPGWNLSRNVPSS